MISKKRLINLRIDDQDLDEIEKIAIEKFNENTSEAIRYLCKLGIKLEKIKPHELDQEKVEEITNEMNQKIKDESFFEFINSKTPDQQTAIKNWISIQQEERIKKESNLY
jgi:Arc/MetJ-type ribon-helix-helix transcriptional regulator